MVILTNGGSIIPASLRLQVKSVEGMSNEITTMTSRWRRFVGLVAACVVFAACSGSVCSAAAAEDGAPGEELVLRDGIVIPPVGRYGRSAVHTDAIEAELVAGQWRAPKSGDVVTLPDGSVKTWEPIHAGEDGWFRHAALGGGYVYVAVPAGHEHVMLLEAAGHAMVYVNGEPRTGDPYGHGYVRLPVRLRQGKNELLFQVGRGQLRAKLLPAKSAVQFDLADNTLPDLIVGEPVNFEAAVVLLNAATETADSLAIEAALPGGEPQRTPVPSLLPLGVRKVGIRLQAPAPAAAGECAADLKLLARDDGEWRELDTARITLRIVTPDQTHKRTFRSAIDGSVQYYAVVPAK